MSCQSSLGELNSTIYLRGSTELSQDSSCDEQPEEKKIHFQLFVIWQLEHKYASVKKHILTLPWTRNLQLADVFGAISKMYPYWKRDEIRLYGRCGDLYLPMKNYITFTATLRHMATYNSDLIYLVKTELKTESMMTVEELKLRWHVREAAQEEQDKKLIIKWIGDEGYEGRIPVMRGEHAPLSERTKKKKN